MPSSSPPSPGKPPDQAGPRPVPFQQQRDANGGQVRRNQPAKSRVERRCSGGARHGPGGEADVCRNNGGDERNQNASAKRHHHRIL
jgi:hypothetical protein